MLVPNTTTQEHGVLAMMTMPRCAPKTRDSTRRRCTAGTVKDTSTNGPVFAATPKGDGPRPQDRRGGAYKRGAVHVGAKIENSCPGIVAHASAGLGKALAMRQQPLTYLQTTL